MRTQMLYTNGPFEICQERMLVKQRWTKAKAFTCCGKNIYAQAKIIKSLHDRF